MEEVLPGVFVDGAHNENGVRAFLDTVSEDKEAVEKILLFSVVSDKDYKTMLYSITSSGLFDRIILAHLKNYRGAALSDMNSILKDYSKGHVEQYDTVKQALDRVLEMRSEETQVYITGSLYLVGEIKEYLKR